MHILAILFVLANLVLALAVIGGMLFAHRERIGSALVDHVVTTAERQAGYKLVGNITQFRAGVPLTPKAMVQPLPLAA